QRRLPKRGFKNINREAYAPLNLGQLELLSQKLGSTSFDVESLVAAGVSKASEKIKLLGKGNLTAKINIKVHAASAAAKAAIEAAGGSVEIV
ncbi:MAG: uL15 family ribosomal protein, partial [Bacteroidota bacterium]